MKYLESDIAHENGKFWVLKLPKDKGFQVYESGITHSTLRDTIGFPGEKGLDKAIEKCDKRARDAAEPQALTVQRSPSPF